MYVGKQLRRLFDDLQKASCPLAVFCFDHGLEWFPIKTDDYAKHYQTQRTLTEFNKNLVGIYDKRINLSQLKDDIDYCRSIQP